MRGKISSELIERYLKGRCSEEEVRAVHDWYASFEDDPEPVDRLSEKDRASLRGRMLERIRENTAYRPDYPEAKASKVRTIWYSVAAVAASVMLVLAVSYYFGLRPPLPEQNIASGGAVATFYNTTGKLEKYILPDSSVVWLRPLTKLSYRFMAKERNRNVTLEGECFFDVKRDTSHPFIISTGSLRTEVLGTSFNVKAYADAPAAEVSVITGKVRVYTGQKSSSPQKTVVLLPQQKAVYDVSSRNIRQTSEEAADLRIWSKKSVSFDNEPVREVVKALNDKFGVDIRIEDPVISNYTLKADFTEQNLPVILEMISRSLDVTYEMKEDKILIVANQN